MLTRTIFAVVLFAVLKCCHAQLPVIPVVLNHAASFTPVSGAFMWYSVKSAVTNNAGTSPPADNDTVKAWGDLSANGFHLQQLAQSLQWGYHTTAGNQVLPPNGSPFMTMTNSGIGGMTNTFNATTFSQPNTYFFVINGSGRAAGPAFMNGKSDQNQQLIWNAPPGGFSLTAGSTMSTANTFGAANQWDVYTFQFNGSSSLMRSNSVSIAFTSGTTVGAGGLKGITLGTYFNFSTANAGFGICEVVGYNSALNSASMLQEEEYLANKYGITSVP